MCLKFIEYYEKTQQGPFVCNFSALCYNRIKHCQEVSVMFHEITPSEIAGNPFQMIGRDWALVTAGDETGLSRKFLHNQSREFCVNYI